MARGRTAPSNQWPERNPKAIAARPVSLYPALDGGDQWGWSTEVADAEAIISTGPTAAFHYQAKSGRNPTGFTHARAGTARYRRFDGKLMEAASGVLRRRHYSVDPLGGSADLRTTLLEPARTNLLLWSEDFSNAAWTSGGTPVVTANDATAPDGAVTADKIEDNDGAFFENKRQDVTVADDTTVHCFSCFVRKRAGAPPALVRLVYSGGTSVTYDCEVNPADGQIETDGAAGTPASADAIAWNDDWWRVFVAGANNGTGNTNARCQVYPAAGSTFGTYDVAATGYNHFWGAQLEEGYYPSAYIPTTSAAVTTVADTLSATWSFTPRAGQFYARFIERGTVKEGTFGRVWEIGAPPGSSDPRVFVSENGSGFYRAFHDNGATGVGSTMAAAPDVGDLVELLATLYSDGSVKLEQSINEAAVTAATQSGAATLQSAWAGTNIYFGAGPAGTVPGPLALLDFVALDTTDHGGTEALSWFRAAADGVVNGAQNGVDDTATTGGARVLRFGDAITALETS